MRTPIAAAELVEPTHSDDPESHLPTEFGGGLGGATLFWIAAAFAAFQIATSFGIPLDKPFLVPGLTAIALAGVVLVATALWVVGAAVAGHPAHGRPLSHALVAVACFAGVWVILARYPGGVPSQVLRTLHVGFLCLLAAGMLAHHRTRTWIGGAALWGLGLLGFAVALYPWVLYHDLIDRSGLLEPFDLAVGVAAIAVLFVLTWRAMGAALPIVAGLFLAYALWGHTLPRPLDHRPFAFDQVVEQMVFGTEGIYGTPTLVSATYIFLFILFGSFMERAGIIEFFNDISMAAFGRARGGPGKVCVASSALMGTVSGSGVANVVASGQFTIPLMRRFGFTKAFAGGVEATSSMGGQIMPPVMGAVAFIMAETIGVPYGDIVIAAIIPAALYFAACFWSVHLEAGRLGLDGYPAEDLPRFLAVIRARWFLMLPLLVLVALLFGGFTPLFAGAVGLALTAVMIIGAGIAPALGNTLLRLAFWLVLAAVSAAALWVSVAAVVLVVLAMVIVGFATKDARAALSGCLYALADGARQALPVGLACAMVGIVIGTMTLTGLGTIVGSALISIGKDNLALALGLTMVFSLILGMGIPTIPNYIITASLAAPILLNLGIPLIVSHMFVFYFGIMADLTPPVALAAFAAAPMAQESGLKIGLQAVRIALPGFIIPFIAVYDSALMLQPVAGVEGLAYLGLVVWVVAKTTVALALWGIAAFGYLTGPVAWPVRGLAFVAALFLVAPGLAWDMAGLAMAGGAVALALRGPRPRRRLA